MPFPASAFQKLSWLESDRHSCELSQKGWSREVSSSLLEIQLSPKDCMEDHLRHKKNSRSQQSLGTSAETKTVQASHQDRVKPEKPNLSYAHLHSEITNKEKEVSLKPSGNHHKQHTKTTKEEELVKYMSNLPSYLERGENRQEKVLNVGVLDWGRLEKWQCSQKQMPYRSSRHSVSYSNSSSSFSTEGSSTNSSRGHSWSPAHQRSRRSSLQFHLMSSPIESGTELAKPFKQCDEKLEDVKGNPHHAVNIQRKLLRTPKSSDAQLKPDQFNGKDLKPNIKVESEIRVNGLNYEGLQCVKAKTKIRDGEVRKRVEGLQDRKAYMVDQDASQRGEAVVLLMPKDVPWDKISRGLQFSESPMILGQRATEQSRRSFSDLPEEVCIPVIGSDVPHSCPLPYDVQRCSVGAESSSFLPDPSLSVPHLAKRGSSTSQCIVLDVKRSITMPENSTLKAPFMGSDLKQSKVVAEKVRSTSPFRRLSIGMGKISKSFSSKEGSSGESQDGTSRARSSPLRRLLDPLLKPKTPNCRHSGESLQQDSTSTVGACKSSDGQLYSSTGTVQPRIIRPDISNTKSFQEKSRSLVFQALLRVAVKNGQPLYTFAVDNESDVLAATMKKLSTPREDEYSCIYTFFSIKETKKKNGRWMHQGSKGKSHDYIPNVVAQLRVSGSQLSNLARQNCIQQYFAREFVLFAVDLQQAEQQTSEFQPNDELAAIVVKIPKVIHRRTNGDGGQTDECDDLQEARFNPTCGENIQVQRIIGSQSLINMTAILPSGIHSLPNKGGPSSLIQRWRSGGSCDCGGWDLGCKLRILANQNQLINKSSSSKACSMKDKFELITQGGEENQPIFSLLTFKDGIYSVEFNSSVSILQAFSLCIAVLDSKTVCDTSESSNLFEEKVSLETILAQNDGIRAPTGIEGDLPGRYVSYPPLSPVGRV